MESDSLYDKIYDPDTSLIYRVDFPSITDPPPPIRDAYVVEEVYHYRGRSFVRLNVFYSLPEAYPWFSHVDVYVAYTDPRVRPPQPPPSEGDYIFRFSATDSFQLDPIGENLEYWIRFNTVSTYGIKQPDDEAYRLRHRVKGVDAQFPPCPTYLRVAVNMTSVDLISPEVIGPDIDGYEVRMGSEWDQSVFLAFNSSPAISFSGVKPGEHKFWLNTKHKNGLYCQHPVSYTAIVEEEPPGSHIFYNEVLDYTDGTLTNMTVTGTYPNQSLFCSHVNSDRYGKFESDEIDTTNLNVEDKMLAMLLFPFSVTGGAITWNALAPPGTDWEEFAYDVDEERWQTWNEILGYSGYRGAAVLDVSLDYSENPGGPYKTVGRLELVTGIVTGRYVKVRIEIVDYSLSSYLTLGPSTLKTAYLEDNLLIGA